jgi:hypothetical protein
MPSPLSLRSQSVPVQTLSSGQAEEPIPINRPPSVIKTSDSTRIEAVARPFNQVPDENDRKSLELLDEPGTIWEGMARNSETKQYLMITIAKVGPNCGGYDCHQSHTSFYSAFLKGCVEKDNVVTSGNPVMLQVLTLEAVSLILDSTGNWQHLISHSDEKLLSSFSAVSPLAPVNEEQEEDKMTV